MSLIDKAFDVANGLSLGDSVGIFYSITDPTSGAGMDAPKGSVILQVPASGEPQLWKKWGSGAKEWKKLQSKTHLATSNPSATNDDVDTATEGLTFERGDFWVNTATSTGFYICFDNTTNAAVWKQTSGGGGADSNAIHINASGEIFGLDLKATPVSDDTLVIEDSDAGNIKKKITVGSISTGTSDSVHVESYIFTSTGASTGYIFLTSTGTSTGYITLTNTPIGAEYVTVSINGIVQNDTVYQISGDLLIFLQGAGSQLTLDGGLIDSQVPIIGDEFRIQIISSPTVITFDPLSVASLVDGTIDGSKLINRSVQGAKLILGTVTEDELADDSIDLSKLNLGGASTQYVRGNDTLGNTSEFTNAFYDQTIAGIKTFSSFPVTPASNPSTNYQVANKTYVDHVTNYILASSTGSVNRIDITPVPADLVAGMSFHIKLKHTNTSATVEIKHVPLATNYYLKRPSTSGLVNVPIGALKAGNVITAVFDGTYFQAISGLPAIWE